MKKNKKVKKPSKVDRIAEVMEQTYAHVGTDEIVRRQTVLACESNVVEHEIIALTAKLADARRHRACLEAQTYGLINVVQRRR
jgi:hypothetical protein